MPRLSKFSFKGITKNEADKLREKMSLVAGKVVTENVIKTNETIIANYFKEKGFLNVEVKMDLITDTSLINSNFMIVNIKKNGKIKIHEIRFTGLEAFTPQKLKSKMKGTKEKHWYSFFTTSKFEEEAYEQDKEKIIQKYLEKGYRDARIISDSVYKYSRKLVNIDINISEGKNIISGILTGLVIRNILQVCLIPF